MVGKGGRHYAEDRKNNADRPAHQRAEESRGICRVSMENDCLSPFPICTDKLLQQSHTEKARMDLCGRVCR